MASQGLGFDILRQQEKNKKGKTFMDYAPGHVGDDNYVTTQSTIIPNTNTTTTNKSGTGKNTATIKKEPNRKPFSWADDDFLDDRDDRAFFEGFYEVDYASSEDEREKRMSKVGKSLRDMRNRRPGDMLRKTKDVFQPVNYSAQNQTVPRSEFHAAPSWFSPLEKSNDNVVNAGREYAKKLVDEQFMRGIEMWFSSGNASSYRYSTLKQADAELQHAKNLASNEEFLRSIVPTLADIGLATRGVPKEEFIPVVLETLSSTSPGISDLVEYGLPKLTEKNLINAQDYRNYLKNDEDQYLVNFKPYREAFVSNLNKELEKIKSRNSFGYSSDDENERFKTAVIEELLRIMYINNNYATEKMLADTEKQ